MKLLTPASYQTKLRKTENGQQEYAVYSVSLSPADIAGTGKSNCAHSTSGCRAACVGTTGLASIWPTIMQARIDKTLLWQTDRKAFLQQLNAEIRAAQRRETDNGKLLAVRLNTFSDVWWERYGVPQEHPHVRFYDYTAELKREQITNYALTYSWKGAHENGTGCIEILLSGRGNVAVTFAQRNGNYAGAGALSQRIPSRYRLPGCQRWFDCIDGDVQDMRFLDAGNTRSGVSRIVALRLKASTTQQRNDAMASGFCQILD